MPEDFTEEEYRELVSLAASRYRFVSFEELDAEPPCVLWRHDLDFSTQRALALARIEAELGVRATYFLSLRSEFYNALEPANVEAIAAVLALGHHLGVHFDVSAGGDDALAAERELLERTFGVRVRAFSVHNPELVGWADDRLEIAGMTNAYAPALRERFAYVSDSNGIWRHRRLRDVLAEGSDERLHVLTHPAWWTPDGLTPRARIQRCIDGRAASTGRAYDELLERSGRPNIA